MKARPRRHLAATACVLFAAACPAAAQRLLFAGNDRAVWLVRPAADGKGVDVLARPVGGKWQWIERGFGGRPTGAATLGRSLRVLFSPDAHVAFHLDGQPPTNERSPRDGNWPPGAVPLALCEATDFAAPNTSSILVVAAGRPAPAASRPTSRPAATGPATRAAAPARTPAATAPGKLKLPTLAVFQFAEGEWSPLPPPGVRVAPGRGVFAAAVDQALYLLLPDAQSGWNRLIVSGGGKWRDVALDAEVARSRVLGMLALDGRLAVLLSRPRPGGGGASAIMAIYKADEGAFDLQPITRDGRPFVWPRSSLPRAAKSPGYLALLWRQGDKTRLATCDRTGQIVSVEQVAVEAAPEGKGVKALEIFLWVVLLGTFVPMILLRPKGPPKPFALPPTLRPASPPKRLLAAAVDLFLSSAVGGAIFMPRDMSPEQATQLLRRITEGSEQLPDGVAYAALASLAIFLAYGLVMELHFGATLGKMLLKMRVVGEGGRKADLREVSLRNLWKIIEMFLPPRLPLLPLVVLFNRNRQRVGDWLARTTVVNVRPVAPPPGPPGEADQPRDDADEHR